jgi:hypothetical protein
MKTLLIALVVTLGSVSAFAQQLEAGQVVTLRCPGSTSPVVNTTSRTVTVNCQTVCRIDIVRASLYSTSGTGFLMRATWGTRYSQNLASARTARELQDQLPYFADLLVDGGKCEYVKY